jgi:hypothetical protein
MITNEYYHNFKPGDIIVCAKNMSIYDRPGSEPCEFLTTIKCSQYALVIAVSVDSMRYLSHLLDLNLRYNTKTFDEVMILTFNTGKIGWAPAHGFEKDTT